MKPLTRLSEVAAGALLLMAGFTAPLIGQTGPSSGPYPIPKTLTMNDATLPYWADVSVVLTEKGEPNQAVLGDAVGSIREIMGTPADTPVYFNDKIVWYSGPTAPDCRAVGPTFYDYVEPPPRATLADAVTHSEVAFLGRVTGKAYGFSGGAPGQLLQVEPVLSYGEPLTKHRYYFFMPMGKFRLGQRMICTTDPSYAEPPDIGGEVFLFVLSPVDPTGVLLLAMDAGDIVPVNADGSLRLPGQYASDAAGAARGGASPRTKADLLVFLQKLRGGDGLILGAGPGSR